jgi:CRP-like cAMP-binding protein
VRRLIFKRPAVNFAIWRLTLVDAAIFRQAATNNGVRPHVPRVAHLMCEQYFRARAAGLTTSRTCSLPLNQAQLGQALGMSLISVHRALQRLRAQKLMSLGSGQLEIHDWAGLSRIAGFDPSYLHLTKEVEATRTRTSSRPAI